MYVYNFIMSELFRPVGYGWLAFPYINIYLQAKKCWDAAPEDAIAMPIVKHLQDRISARIDFFAKNYLDLDEKRFGLQRRFDISDIYSKLLMGLINNRIVDLDGKYDSLLFTQEHQTKLKAALASNTKLDTLVFSHLDLHKKSTMRFVKNLLNNMSGIFRVEFYACMIDDQVVQELAKTLATTRFGSITFEVYTFGERGRMALEEMLNRNRVIMQLQLQDFAHPRLEPEFEARINQLLHRNRKETYWFNHLSVLIAIASTRASLESKVPIKDQISTSIIPLIPEIMKFVGLAIPKKVDPSRVVIDHFWNTQYFRHVTTEPRPEQKQRPQPSASQVAGCEDSKRGSQFALATPLWSSASSSSFGAGASSSSSSSSFSYGSSSSSTSSLESTAGLDYEPDAAAKSLRRR